MTKTAQLLQGDVLACLPELEAESFDACLCDAPYGLSEQKPQDIERCLEAWAKGEVYRHGKGGFMSADWDHWVPGPEVWREVFRCLKPGAPLAVFAGSRTWDLMATAIEMAGFGPMKGTVLYSYASGFPKSLSIGKKIDAKLGATREVLDRKVTKSGGMARIMKTNADAGYRPTDYYAEGNVIETTAPATEQAKQWEGWGTQLKPAFEPLLVFQKPGGDTELVLPECRVFYGSKASKKERNAGLQSLPEQRGGSDQFDSRWKEGTGEMRQPLNQNTHPTLKSIDLVARMAKACLAPQHGQRVLVPFSGSGSEVIALLQAGYAHATGIELSDEFSAVSKLRVAHWTQAELV